MKPTIFVLILLIASVSSMMLVNYLTDNYATALQTTIPPLTNQGSSLNEQFCSSTDKVRGFNATLNALVCAVDETSEGGTVYENNTASNIGSGVGVFQTKSGVDLIFHSLLAGSGISITDIGNELRINSTVTPGESNTGANVGSGTGLIFRDKTGVTLNFKSLVQGSGITIANNANDISISASGSGESNVGENVGTGDASVYAGKSGVNLQFKRLDFGQGITFANNTNDIDIATSFIVNSQTCSGTDKVSGIDVSTGSVTCSTDETGGGSTGTLIEKSFITTDCVITTTGNQCNNNLASITGLSAIRYEVLIQIIQGANSALTITGTLQDPSNNVLETFTVTKDPTGSGDNDDHTIYIIGRDATLSGTGNYHLNISAVSLGTGSITVLSSSLVGVST